MVDHWQHPSRHPPILAVLTSAAAIVLLVSSCLPTPTAEDPANRITVGWSPFEHSTLLFVAEDQRFFARNGLNVVTRQYDLPALGLDAMAKGEVDIVVGAAEWPVVGRVFQKTGICIIGNVAKSQLIHLVARKDRGIARPSDLKGKRVGTTAGSVSEFYLGRFLTLNGMSLRDVTAVDVRTPAEWVNAVVTGEIDAVVTDQPHVNLIRERLGANAVVWPAQASQPLFALEVSTDAWIRKHPEPVNRFLRSLAQAEEFVIRSPDQAKAIVQKRLGLNASYTETVWDQNQFSLSLDLSLVAAMEDEARWMISNKLTTENTVPDFMNFVYEAGLKAVKPEAVNIIR